MTFRVDALSRGKRAQEQGLGTHLLHAVSDVGQLKSGPICKQ